MNHLSFSKPVENATLRILSLGAGVQSSVMALMAAKGEIGPRPDAMIFADTQWEPDGVMEHLDWLEGEVIRLTNGQMPLYKVTAGDIRADHINGLNSTGQRFASMPLYTAGGGGMGRRQCTSEYKIDPVRKKVRELLGVDKGKRVPKTVTVEQWLGISTDEIQRLKDSRDKWCQHRWPLIEEGMSRQDCLTWWRNNYPERELAKSACVVCPFKSNAEWRYLRDSQPHHWLEAVNFDAGIRENGSKFRKMDAQQFVHRSAVPLSEADLSTPEDRGQMSFLDECEGMCGI